MPWTNIARREHKRATDRYPSDLTDAEWLVIASLLPAAKRSGRKRTTELREVVNGILYIASSGCPWRMLPKDFPPMTTVPGYFYAWRDMELFDAINGLLVGVARESKGRSTTPSAVVIDYQSGQKILPDIASRLCGWGKCRTKASGCPECGRQMDSGDHQALRQDRRLCPITKTMGHRTNVCLAGAVPPFGKRLGENSGKFNCMVNGGEHPVLDQEKRKTLCSNINF